MNNQQKINAAKLKVKAMSLGAESKIIRKIEKTVPLTNGGNNGGSNLLYLHRVIDVRNESRATHLARAYLAGKTYSSIESSRKPEKEVSFQYYTVKRVKTLVDKYGCGKKFDDEWFKS